MYSFRNIFNSCLLISANLALLRIGTRTCSGLPVNLKTIKHDVYNEEGFLKSSNFRSEQDSSRDIETLIVTDAGMSRFHGDNLETYILTVMNIVSALYMSPSLQNNVKIKIVKWVNLKENSDEFVVSNDASSTLRNFCDWQSNRFPNNGTGTPDVDIAVLLTKHNIGKGIKSMLGLSDKGGACSKLHQCVLAQDNGLAVAFTIAHEIGHSLGMNHDGEGNACPDDGHIMSSGPPSGQYAFTWSSCSTMYLHNFLRSEKSSCLNDSRRNNTNERSKPGKVYDAKSQCQLAFNDSIDECPGKMGDCKILWCLRPMANGVNKSTVRCTSNLIPKMDGTECGVRKWCITGECIEESENKAMEATSLKVQTGNLASTVPCYRGDRCNKNRIPNVTHSYFEDPVDITSPNFPGEYPKNYDHSYVINAPYDHLVHLEFSAFHIEDHSLCLYDYLQILDVSSEEYETYCGLLSTPFHVRSVKNILQLNFHSDRSIQMSGFSAQIKFVPDFLKNT